MLGYIVAKTCASPGNLTRLTRPFLLVRGCGLGTRLASQILQTMASCGAQGCLNISLLRCCHAGLLRGCPMAENLHTLLHTLQTLVRHLSMQTNSLQTKASGGAHSCRLLRGCPMAETLLLPHFQTLACHLSMQSNSLQTKASGGAHSCLVPRLVRGRGEKNLVHTVCACSVFPGFLGIWKFP